MPVLLLGPFEMSLAVAGLISGILSGVAELAAFAAAALLRVRSWSAFGVRRVSWRWLLVGFGGGVVALLVKIAIVSAFVALTGVSTDTQAGYAASADGGALFLVLSLVSVAVITPIGEELFFRGVLTTALLRYGPLVGVGGSAVVFALLHGINFVLPAALIVGLITAELRRRSGSIWPGVVVHAVNNALGILALTVIPSLG